MKAVIGGGSLTRMREAAVRSVADLCRLTEVAESAQNPVLIDPEMPLRHPADARSEVTTLLALGQRGAGAPEHLPEFKENEDRLDHDVTPDR